MSRKNHSISFNSILADSLYAARRHLHWCARVRDSLADSWGAIHAN